VVRDRSTGLALFEHRWRHDQIEAAESDYEAISRDLLTLSRDEFLAEYSADDVASGRYLDPDPGEYGSR
jgi:hypothetical protein